MLVEDDPVLGQLQKDYLEQQGIDVRWLKDGQNTLAELRQFNPALLILDLMLPGMSGLDICREIRQHYQGLILFLTASEDDIDHVTCLELGADDFVNKPINPRVLLARVRMLLRRKSPESKIASSSDSLEFGILKLKQRSREVYLDKAAIKLTGSEFALLWILASHYDEVLDRQTLFSKLRGIEFDGFDRSIDTKIVSLRKKLSDTGAVQKRIITVRNKGYLFASDGWND